MKPADAVLVAIPATYVAAAVLALLGLTLSVALGLGSVVAMALVGQALFVDPPT